MPIPFTCPHCGLYTTVGDEYAGQTGPCNGCGAPVTVPGSNPFNPYQSPQSTWTAAGEPAQLQGGIGWILFSFDGRIPRRTWWLVNILKNVGIYGLFLAFFGLSELGVVGESGGDFYFVVVAVAVLILVVPIMWITLAVTCKRFHDRDKSG